MSRDSTIWYIGLSHLFFQALLDVSFYKIWLLDTYILMLDLLNVEPGYQEFHIEILDIFLHVKK